MFQIVIQQMRVLISGISASGKTTLGKALAERLGFVFVDGDSFYLKKKPKVLLSNGEIVSNWDCVEAIDWDALNAEIASHDDVIFVFFAPMMEKFLVDIDFHIRLNMGETIENKCIEWRSKTKPFSDKERLRDKLMVKEVVIPFWEQFSNQYVDYVLDVFCEDERRPAEELLDELCEEIRLNHQIDERERNAYINEDEWTQIHPQVIFDEDRQLFIERHQFVQQKVKAIEMLEERMKKNPVDPKIFELTNEQLKFRERALEQFRAV